jgi:ABC-type multidrug transport system ATPase subunit
MKIKLAQCGIHFNRDWIFRKIDYTFLPGSSTAILGPNGSGKSTLLKALSGFLTLNEGEIVYTGQNDKIIPRDEIFSRIGYCGPYIDLIEELTIREQIEFHARFKPVINNLDTGQIIEKLGFDKHQHKTLKNLSSGMRQRLKLALTVLSDTPVLLLDEPATNLDADGVEWYHQLLEDARTDNRIIIIASNRKDEYQMCEDVLNIVDFK